MAGVDDFDYMCRLCATKTEILLGLPIFDHADNVRRIDKKIVECLPIQVSMNDELPKVICEECAFRLDDLFEFREKCRQTEDLFLEMLKGLKRGLSILTVMPQIAREIDRLQEDISGLTREIEQNGLDSIEGTVQGDDSNVHSLQVMDDMDLAGGEQVVSNEIHQDEIEITEIDPLEENAVEIVRSHIGPIPVSEHQIAILEDHMTVVDHMGMNYVTGIDSESPTEGQIYDNNVKFEGTKEYELHERLSEGNHEDFPQEQTNENLDILNEALDTAGPSEDPKQMTEYTKAKKRSLLETSLNNPTIDETGTSWYVCPFCNEASTEPNSLAEHFDLHFFTCPCGLFFAHVDDLIVHKKSCKIWLKKSKTKNDKVVEAEPAKEETPKKNQARTWTPKVCAQCGKQYRTNYKLQEHMRKHTGEKPFQCSMCDKAFRSKIGLAQHTATHTGQFDYSCSTCGKGFQCKSYLIVHQRVHSDLKPYPCSTCGQNFKTKQSLLDHQNRHLGVKPYICDICGRGFITKGLCKSHQKIHSGMDNRQYPCEVCNKMFVSKSYLNTHLRIHTGEKPYLCEVCGKGFLTRVDLKIHSTMHTGEKSFKCEMCNKVFARRAALRCHRRSHTGERPYRCDVCGKTFTQFSPMAIHKRLHTGERPYECDVCGKTFVSRSTMMCHRKKHHTSVAMEKLDTVQETREELIVAD